MTNTTIGKRLKSLRESAGLKPVQLGRLADLKSPGHISMIERGERGIDDEGRVTLSATVAVSLARVLGCSVEYLVNGNGDAPDEATVRAHVKVAQMAAGIDPNAVADDATPDEPPVADRWLTTGVGPVPTPDETRTAIERARSQRDAEHTADPVIDRGPEYAQPAPVTP